MTLTFSGAAFSGLFGLLCRIIVDAEKELPNNLKFQSKVLFYILSLQLIRKYLTTLLLRQKTTKLSLRTTRNLPTRKNVNKGQRWPSKGRPFWPFSTDFTAKVCPSSITSKWRKSRQLQSNSKLASFVFLRDFSTLRIQQNNVTTSSEQ